MLKASYLKKGKPYIAGFLMGMAAGIISFIARPDFFIGVFSKWF